MSSGRHGDHVAQIVRGETARLSDGERQEILQGRISYYPNDLAVIGWNASFLYDSEFGSRNRDSTAGVCQFALLEFRHYDELLTRELEGVYDFLETGAAAYGPAGARPALRPSCTPFCST